MKKPIEFDQVADIYDFYVNVDFDIPFFMKETEGFSREILELMCGTGRVSIPLLELGRTMTCVDYSKGMLGSFAQKIQNKNYPVDLVEMDVTELDLKKKFGMILLPFHSISEILTPELQRKALKSISSHLEKNGIFILTLQNPAVRLKMADGEKRVIGDFPVGSNRRMVISYENQYNPSDQIVSGHQFYEIYDSANTLIEERVLEINFRPISDSELKEMIAGLELEITKTYGDYSHGKFDTETSNFMIYKMIRR